MSTDPLHFSITTSSGPSTHRTPPSRWHSYSFMSLLILSLHVYSTWRALTSHNASRRVVNPLEWILIPSSVMRMHWAGRHSQLWYVFDLVPWTQSCFISLVEKFTFAVICFPPPRNDRVTVWHTHPPRLTWAKLILANAPGQSFYAPPKRSWGCCLRECVPPFYMER